MPGWEKALAIFTFVAFYVLILAIPLLGWAAVSAHARGEPSFFGVPVPKLPVSQDRATGEQLGDLHMLLAWSAVVLVVLHVAGAIKNSYFQKNHELSRMIPGLRTPDA
jgi:cytochrome b561